MFPFQSKREKSWIGTSSKELIGHEGTNQYRIWIEGSKEIIVTRGVVFDGGPRSAPVAIGGIPQIGDKIETLPEEPYTPASMPIPRGFTPTNTMTVPKQWEGLEESDKGLQSPTKSPNL
jgi:hypothetical protein